jgi:hypothetical protein
MVSDEDRGKEGNSAGGINEDQCVGRSVIPIGNSKGVTLPAEWMDRMGADENSSADLSANFEQKRVVLELHD